MFKIGDWVRCIEDNDIFQLDISFAKQLNEDCQDCEAWQPKEGEWIIILPIHPTMDKPRSFTVRQYFENDPYWKLHIEKCEPFLGKLPSFLKK